MLTVTLRAVGFHRAESTGTSQQADLLKEHRDAKKKNRWLCIVGKIIFKLWAKKGEWVMESNLTECDLIINS